MLALLLLAHPGTFAMLGALYGGALVAINQILLPTIALLSVRTHCHECLHQRLGRERAGGVGACC